MFSRLLTLSKKRSFFLFGARNTGKSTLLQRRFDSAQTYWIDLLDRMQEDRLSRNPEAFYELVLSLPEGITHVVIDEVQKIPKLLDEVHRLMAKTDKVFVMTGSSAKKLRQKGVNLLAGRAFIYHLFPLSPFELGDQFDLDLVLNWGGLPNIFNLEDDKERSKFLQAYAQTYLREEIWQEHFIRKRDPFRKFLDVAAQTNGKIVNYANIARDVGVEDKTVASYYSILEETLIGFFLEPFHSSVRKRLSEKPKFYFFDTGLVKALRQTLSIPLMEQSYGYGDAFEHFIVLEVIKLAHYFEEEWRFSYLRTPGGIEVDLIIERPGAPPYLIEIKSAQEVEKVDLRGFLSLTRDFGECEAICLSRDPYVRKIEHVTAYPWMQGLKKIFGGHIS